MTLAWPTISGISPPWLYAGGDSEFLRGKSGYQRQNGIIETRASWSTLVREDLNKRAPRMMAVLRPLRVVIDNYPEGDGSVDELDAVNNPEGRVGRGTRKVPFSPRALHRARRFPRKFRPKGYYRLSPGKEVRLRWGLSDHLHGRG